MPASIENIPVREGRLPFRGFTDWYKIVGDHTDPGKFPVLVLHGGPGAAHDYLEPIGALAATGRQVIFYDQLGCGLSDHPHDPSLWEVGLFIEEVSAVRAALGLENVHILGQSWGGMLGMEYALTQPTGLKSLIVANSPASMTQWVSEANRLRTELPEGVQAALTEHEVAGTTDSAEYVDAVNVFYGRHVCRIDPLPDYVKRSFDQIDADPEVYHTMNGPSEFYVVGKLKGWDITPRLPDITVPTLVLSGRYDEATPLIAGTVQHGIPGSEWTLFENSSHMPHAEETARYLEVVDEFLTRIEKKETS